MDELRAFLLLLSPCEAGKLSHSNCHHKAFNPVTHCHALHLSPSRKGLIPVPGAGQRILQSPGGGSFPSFLSSHSKETDNAARISLNKTAEEAWKCLMGEETPSSGKSSTWVGTARRCPLSSAPCPGWDKCPPLEWRHSSCPARGGELSPQDCV